MVVAPAGWGKTSLLSRWASTTASTTPLAWVSLDENDDEPVRFWRYLLTALREADDQLSSAALDALAAANTAPTDLALPLLINELAATPNRHVLVLDDYQAITDRAIHESVEFFLSYLPPTAQVVIASRWDPPLPLARMRARGELVELRANDLRFSPDEAAAMVSAVAESPLDDTAASALWERTEGWAAGLQLAGLALRGSRDPSAAAARVRGDDRHLFDYFTSEVIPGLVPEQRDLLIRAAPLELLSGSLCDAALQVAGLGGRCWPSSSAPTCSSPRWTVIGTGIAATACCATPSSADRAPPTRPRPAQCSAERREWFAEHGRIDEAVRHLQLAGDEAAAAELLQAHQSWFFDHGWAAALLQHAERLAEAAVPPQLALPLSYAAKISGHPDRVVHWIDVAERQIDDDTVHRRLAERAGRGADDARDQRHPGRPTRPGRSPCASRRSLWRQAAGTAEPALALTALGSAYAFDGRFDDAAHDPGRCLATTRTGPLVTKSRPPAGRSARGQPCCSWDAARTVDRVLAEAAPLAADAEQNWGGAAAPLVVQLRLAEARRRYELGDFEAAGRRLDRALRLAEDAGNPLTLVLSADLPGRSRAGRWASIGGADRAAARPGDPRQRAVGAVRARPAERGRDPDRSGGRAQCRPGPASCWTSLTDREMSILRMLPGTASQREIGAALFLSINTVKAYNKSLYRKLGAASRSEAVSHRPAPRPDLSTDQHPG